VCTREFQPEDNDAFIIHVNLCISSNERQQLLQEQQQLREQEQQQPPQLDLPGAGEFV